VRQTQAGISEYEWSTSGDERVRSSHDELDGTRQSWDDPPVTNDDGDTNHPGEDYQCRCVAIPVLPDIGDLTDSEEPEDESESEDEEG
jgi:SPP1 gp7 family putative phage head morphogenesis protein